MPKLIQINAVCNNSSGRIMHAIQEEALRRGWETLTIYGRRQGFSDVPSVRCGNGLGFWLHVALTTATDRNGEGSIAATRQMLRILRREQPDVLQLHNVHGYYLNYPMLFRYLKEEFRGEVVWTMHDCWAYTGHCAFYTASCEKWLHGCGQCPHRREYPWSFGLEDSAGNWKRKRESFCGVPHMTLAAPSEWIRGNVERSFLREYPVRVIANGTDPAFFHPQTDCSGGGAAKGAGETAKVPERLYGIDPNRRILLGVASAWNERKGMEVFRYLARCIQEGILPGYQVVLVGMNAAQRRSMPEGIVHIERTADRHALADLYRAAWALLNPSEEESFSMVTVEALACGTPVIALDSSAVKELVPADCGILLHEPELPAYLAAIHTLERKREDGSITGEAAAQRGAMYTEERQIQEYLALYEMLVLNRYGHGVAKREDRTGCDRERVHCAQSSGTDTNA